MKSIKATISLYKMIGSNALTISNLEQVRKCTECTKSRFVTIILVRMKNNYITNVDRFIIFEQGSFFIVARYHLHQFFRIDHRTVVLFFFSS